MRFAVANVIKPLGAVGEICQAGHKVVFDDLTPGGSHIESHTTGERVPMRKENGVYVMDVWVAPPSDDQSTFRGQVGR